MSLRPIPIKADMDGGRTAAIRNAASVVTLTAQGAISGHKAIVELPGYVARYPSLTAANDADLIVGVSTNAAADGGDVYVQTAGELAEPSWNWTPGPVFAGNNGVLTQSPPTGAWIRQVGVAVAPTIMVVNLRPSFMTP